MEQELTEESVRPGATDWYTEGAMKTIDVSHLPPEALLKIERILDEYRDAAASAHNPRRIGWAKDVLPPLPETFFDELPEEFLEAFGVDRPDEAPPGHDGGVVGRPR